MGSWENVFLFALWCARIYFLGLMNAAATASGSVIVGAPSLKLNFET
jgi:hypothetical protein